MTQDEIIKLAKEYGFTGGFDADGNLLHDEAFVVAVTEAVDAEREACAVIVENADTPDGWSNDHISEAIRARGEA